ncbi:PAS and ANTAR domain-containing protein [Arthrobacter sp. SLBN-53]|uniref:PAS and ANTAR domain-containing protein n=1 Tax=Arthrobacter sp. SLBN-53 TaxID=2768412 RepID=UPI001150615A|nr:PAS and ANTAR domain-containing protein [Arthrobacter sp. SLBN-53]TQK31007.1 PAS domain-containing protein [Arthrobacter sp. SLBN-53]
MADDTPEEQPAVERGLADGGPWRVGWYRFYFADERWEWSPEVERMHGYEPGTARPTTEMVLAHKHPEDGGQVAATLDGVRRTATAFSTRHRIVDTRGDTHDVVVVGDRLFDESGHTVIGSHGFYIDVTPPRAVPSREQQDQVSEVVAEITEARSGIEQAKGMLMLIYRINGDAAFELLRWRSQETNTRLKSLSEQLVKDFLELDYHERLPHRSVYDRLLLTAHLRADS